MRDQLIPSEQSERLADRLEEVGVKHLLIRLPWATHFCDHHFTGPCGQITTYAVERFLDGVMRKSSRSAQLTDRTVSTSRQPRTTLLRLRDQRSENGQRKIVRICNWVTSAVPQGRKANDQRGNVAGRSTPSTDVPEVT